MNTGQLRERWYRNTRPMRALFGCLVIVALVVPFLHGLEPNWRFVAISLAICIIATAIDRRAARLSDHGKAMAISSVNMLGFLLAAEVLLINIEIDPNHRKAFLSKYTILMGLSLAQLFYLTRATTPFWRERAANQ
jgi:hypothetical protein